jgi:hypothetical protein
MDKPPGSGRKHRILSGPGFDSITGSPPRLKSTVGSHDILPLANERQTTGSNYSRMMKYRTLASLTDTEAHDALQPDYRSSNPDIHLGCITVQQGLHQS